MCVAWWEIQSLSVLFYFNLTSSLPPRGNRPPPSPRHCLSSLTGNSCWRTRSESALHYIAGTTRVRPCVHTYTLAMTAVDGNSRCSIQYMSCSKGTKNTIQCEVFCCVKKCLKGKKEKELSREVKLLYMVVFYEPYYAFSTIKAGFHLLSPTCTSSWQIFSWWHRH